MNALLAGVDPAMIDGGEQIAEYLGMSEPSAPAATRVASQDSIPSQQTAEGKAEFDAGKATRDERLQSAPPTAEAAPAVNTIETPDSGRTPEVHAGEKDTGIESVDGNGDKNDKDGKRAPIFGKDGYEIPKAVKALYVAVDGKFVDRKTEQISFEDIGRKLSTKSEDRKVIEHMIAVAEAKNWGTLDLKGTEAFRRQAWIAAEVAGLETTGYKPNAQDRAAVEARRAEMRISAGEKTAEQSRENTIEANADKAKAATAPDKVPAEKAQTIPKPEPKQETKAPAPAADPAQAQQMTPEQLAELRKELGEWREQKTKEDIAEVVARHSDPAKRRQNAMELLRSVGRDPSEFFDENGVKPSAVQAGADKDKDATKSIEPSVPPADKSEPQTSPTSREAAARLVLENELNNMGLPEADRQAALDNLNAAFADARAKGVELDVPEPMVVDRAVSIDQSKAVEVTQPQPTHTQEVER